MELRQYDEETFHHCMRVGRDSRFLAKAAGLSLISQQKLEWAGMLHDVGKARIPKELLFKPAKLTIAEYKLVQEHSRLSAVMMEPLTAFPFFREILSAVLHHHERLDGQGYPFGLQGNEIPFGSRIILIADTFDAMTHRRAYRPGLSEEVAFQELQKFAGTQFDAHLVDIYLKHKPMFHNTLEPLEQTPVITGTEAAPEPTKEAA